MNKEKFRENVLLLLGYCDGNTIDKINEAFDIFFESNVCITKGDSRHHCADELHLIAENTYLPYQVAGVGMDEWSDGQTIHLTQYRIKPSEPVYEWQWVKSNASIEIARSSFFTDYEAKMILTSYWKKDESTERERK